MSDSYKYFTATRRLYKCAGFHLFGDKADTMKEKIPRFICAFDFVMTIPLLVIGTLLSEDLIGFTESLVITINVFNSSTKFFAILINTEKVQDTFRSLRQLIEEQLKHSESKRSILLKNKNRVDWLLKVFLSNFIVCVSAAVLNTIAENIRYPEHTRLPLKMWLPITPGTRFYLIFGFILQIFQCSVGILSFTFSYMTFIGLIVHVSSQISILIEELDNLGDKSSAEQQIVLGTWVQNHRTVIRLVKSINEIFGRVLFLEIVLSSVQSCLVVFNCSQRPLSDPKQLFFMPFLICTTIMPFTICWCGELLVTKSEQLFEAVYNCGWYKMQPKIRKDILLILLNSTSPLTLNSDETFFLNLATFLATIQTAYSYLTMLTSVDN
ncbi:hypothetical protein O3M35_010168 [Rhynocoris fuscipes]|uniref:Odorant receptor n=1 Tax=Rhynocoris fuscipes TaxID=488301 RepID=A0AAW1CXW6_9HEMI